jgi:hypothetical protein
VQKVNFDAPDQAQPNTVGATGGTPDVVSDGLHQAFEARRVLERRPRFVRVSGSRAFLRDQRTTEIEEVRILGSDALDAKKSLTLDS